jgi:glycosyltransferase involved in cell wall biosynthesis
LVEKYLSICNKNEIINNFHFKKNKKPKVSIISPVLNREKYILRFINSIQNQIINEIEIIFIDDFSKDKSVKIIESCQLIDQRIILIKNKKKRGTFISRNIGALKSSGEYIMFPDPDDILSQNIIHICYNLAKKNQYEMIRFNIYEGKGNIFFSHIVNKLKSLPIRQPELSTYLFYGLGKLRQIDFNVSNKFIKRSSFIIVLNCLEKYYLYIFMIILEDGLTNYMLYRTVKSFYFLKKIGYYYIQNEGSITKNTKKISSVQSLNFKYIYSKIVFDYSKNTLYERNILNYLLKALINISNINSLIIFLKNDFYFLNNKDYSFYNYFINSYLELKIKNKDNLKKIKYIINKKINKSI